MAPTYKLHYFNAAAVGETARFLLAYGKANWEDARFEHGEWAQIKSKMPFGQVPVLEIDGKKFAQSNAINRYLGKQFGLAGKDDLENLQIDMVADLVVDMNTKLGGWHWDPVPESKAAKEGPLFKEQLPFFLNKFEEMIKANGGYLVGGRLTWADIVFVAPQKVYMWVAKKGPFKGLEGYPGIQALVKKVESIPEIASYIAKRPSNPELE